VNGTINRALRADRPVTNRVNPSATIPACRLPRSGVDLGPSSCRFSNSQRRGFFSPPPCFDQIDQPRFRASKLLGRIRRHVDRHPRLGPAAMALTRSPPRRRVRTVKRGVCFGIDCVCSQASEIWRRRGPMAWIALGSRTPWNDDRRGP